RWAASRVASFSPKVCDAGHAETRRQESLFQPNSFHLAQCNFVLRPVVEFGGARRPMPGHLLGVFQPSVVLEVDRDAGSPPCMTSYRGKKTRISGPLADSRPGIVAVECSSGHCRSSRINALE